MKRIEWDLTDAQIREIKRIAPDLMELLMAGLTALSSQTHQVVELLRKDLTETNARLDEVNAEVLKLRTEVANLQVAANRLYALNLLLEEKAKGRQP